VSFRGAARAHAELDRQSSLAHDLKLAYARRALNPYAPPRAPIDLPPPPVQGGSAPWTLTEAMGVAWRAFAANWPALLFAPMFGGLVSGAIFFVALAAGILPSGLDRLFEKPASTWNDEIARAMSAPRVTGVLLAYAIVAIILDSFFRGGLTRMRIAAVRGDAVRFVDLFSGASCFGSMLALRFLLGAPSLAATGLLLVARVLHVPALAGVATAASNLYSLALLVAAPFGLALADFYVVDRKEGPFAALRSAFAAPAGDRAGVFGFILVAGLVAVAGLCCCFLPAIVSWPFGILCIAVLYTRLTNTAGPRTET
jgi:hypothetical protein